MRKVLIKALLAICVPFSNSVYDQTSDWSCIQVLLSPEGMEEHIEEEGKQTHCRGMWSSSCMCLET